MKINKIIYSLIAVLTMLMAACSPDDPSMGSVNLTQDDLAQGKGFDVQIDPATNTVTLKSLLPSSYHCYWIEPNGRAQGNEVTLQLPFAGTYDVTFGVDTRGGVVYGKPGSFTLTTNNMALLQDKLYEYLTGGVGKSKVWVPVDKSYGQGNCSGPVMYCNPGDVLNDGSNSTDIGYEMMKPNWDPGFQSWLIPEDDPYMDSYMEFGLSDKDGCTLKEYRGENGTKGASTGIDMNGKYTLNLSDAKHPVLSFTDTYAMHNKGFDEVCDNYTKNIYIVELTPYILQLATMRTNSEGAWWIIWNFVAKDVQDGKVQIPSDDPGYLTVGDPEVPEISDLATKLFTTDINGVSFIGQELTYLISDETPYDEYWWNGGARTWDAVIKGNYTKTWTPKPGDEIADFELTLGRDGKYTAGDVSGTYTLSGNNTITFDKEVTFVTAKNDYRTVEVKGTEFKIFKVDPGSEIVIGVPESKDAKGNVNGYLTTTLTYKAVGGKTGPVVVPFDASKVNCYIEADKYFRVQLYNPWGGGNDAVDPAKLKLKKNQTIKINLTLSGFTFEQAAKMALCLNRGEEQSWEPDCYSYARAVTVNADGTYTVSWTNDTGATANFADGTSALTITMQYAGYASLPDEDYASHCTINSITIE